MGTKRADRSRAGTEWYPTSPVQLDDAMAYGGKSEWERYNAPDGRSGRGHVAIPMPIGEEGVELGLGTGRRQDFPRTHSSLWEFWTRLGSGRHELDISNEGVLLHASPPKRSPARPSLSPLVETTELVEKSVPDPWWRRFGSLMKYRRARNTILCLLLLLGLALATYIVANITIHGQQKHHRELQGDCDEYAERIQHEFLKNRQQVSVLRGLIETFYTNTSSPTLTQAIFAQYMAATSFARPLVQTVLYATRVNDPERPGFRHSTRKPILDFGGKFLRAASKFYGPVMFVDNPSPQPHPGYQDVLQIPQLHAAASQATISGNSSLSAPFVWPGGSIPTLAMLLPFYSANFSSVSRNSSLGSLDQTAREKNSVGWLVAAFDMKALIGTIQLQKTTSEKNTKLHIYDVTNLSYVATLYSPSFVKTNSTPVVLGSIASALEFGDPSRVFELRCSGGGEAPFPYLAVVWGIVTLVITLLIAHFLRSAGKRIGTMESAYVRMKSLRDQTMDAKVAAEQADNSKSQFLATVSHEIRTPLNGVLGMLSLLKDTKLDAVQIDYVQTAVSSGKALIGLINDVLDFSKIEAGKMEIDSAAFDVRSEVDDVLSLFAEKVRSRNVELAALIQLAVPPMLVGDSGRFRQVLVNLIGNATKFTEHGHILVTIRLLDDDKDLSALHNSPNGVDGAEEDEQDPMSPQPEPAGQRTRRRTSISNIVRFPAVAFSLAGTTQPGQVSDSDQWPGSDLEQGSKDKWMDQMKGSWGRKLGNRARSTSRPSAENEMMASAWGGEGTTLSGRPTASGAHTYDRVMKWMHQKAPRLQSKSARLAISVEDTGGGIPIAAQGHIFQPFRQADSSTSRKAGGTGIGLSISKKLVELQGGSMGFVSKPSVGSTFFFDVRLQLPEASQAPPLNRAQKLGLPQVESLPGKRVLLVDSSKVRRKVLATHLRALGVLVDMADTPAQAVYMAQSFLRTPAGKLPEEHQNQTEPVSMAPPRLSRTKSCESTDVPIVPARRQGGRRRSMEGFAEAAKAVGLGFLSPFSNSSPSYFGSSPSNMGSTPSQLTASDTADLGSPPVTPSDARQLPFRDVFGRPESNRFQSSYSDATDAGSAHPGAPRASSSRRDSAGNADSANENDVQPGRNLPGKPDVEDYSAILIDADCPQWEKRGLELGEMIQGHEQLAGKPLILVAQKGEPAFEQAARAIGFKAVLLKPLRQMSVAVSIIQALGLASSERVAEMRALTAADSSAKLGEVLKGRRILCVDDNLVNRRVAAKMLGKYGVEALCAPSGASALDMLATQPAMDLIFMDLQMPEMDGYETSAKIRELEKLGTVGNLGNTPRRLPIIAMTADVLKGTREKCLAAGMDGYITKPIDSNELLKTVTRFFPKPNQALQTPQR